MADKKNLRNEIRTTLQAYESIIDFDEGKEVFSLFMDLVEIMEGK